jgi:hypothetical protein
LGFTRDALTSELHSGFDQREERTMTREFRVARRDVERLLSKRIHMLSLTITQRDRGNENSHGSICRRSHWPFTGKRRLGRTPPPNPILVGIGPRARDPPAPHRASATRELLLSLLNVARCSRDCIADVFEGLVKFHPMRDSEATALFKILVMVEEVADLLMQNCRKIGQRLNGNVVRV